MGFAEGGTKPTEPADGMIPTDPGNAVDEWIELKHLFDHELGLADEGELVFLDLRVGVEPEVCAVGEDGGRDEAPSADGFVSDVTDPQIRSHTGAKAECFQI